MPRLAVVSFPVLDRVDLDWIESIRARYDPQSGRIPPHFTLVFPVDTSLNDVRHEFARTARRHAPIPFVLRSVVARPDAVHGGAHVFAVPDEGHDQIARLHDELYGGVLRPHLREDIVFVPHVTIAGGDAGWCEVHARRLNESLRPVRGVIESMMLLDVTGTEPKSLVEFALGTPPSQSV